MINKLDTVLDWAAAGRTAQYDAVVMAEGANVSLRWLEQCFHSHRDTTPQRWLAKLKREISRSCGWRGLGEHPEGNICSGCFCQGDKFDAIDELHARDHARQ
jgi:hypothetical protein